MHFDTLIGDLGHCGTKLEEGINECSIIWSEKTIEGENGELSVWAITMSLVGHQNKDD